MSPYLRQVKTASGATAVQIVVKKHGVRTIVEHLGSAHSDAELAVLMAAGRDKLAQGQLAFDYTEASPARVDAPAVVQGQESRILWQVLCRAYEQLGFDAAVGGDEGFRQMVLARLVEPTSKEDTVRVIGELGVEPVTVRTLFRSLQRCQERSWRENLQQAMFAHAARCEDLSLVLYDTTTLYFEAEKEDSLRKMGYSKERRVDPQLVVGLLVDRTGFPLEVACFEGNKPETHTLIPMINAFRQRHGVEHIVVVADAGMLSSANLKALHAAGVGFIVGSKGRVKWFV